MRKLLTLLTLIFSVSVIFSQSEKDFPSLLDTEINGGKILRTSYYDGTSLWGLIDGGADIYLEYGFDKLLFQEIELAGAKFRAEIYKMNDSNAALGIFSVSRYKCTATDTITKFICITNYQVQSAIGKYYISISNEKGDKDAQRQTLNLFLKYLGKINESPAILPELFAKKAFEGHKNQVKFIRGRLGIQNGFPAWIDLLDPFDGYEIYILPIESVEGYANIAQIKFKTEDDAKKFIVTNKPGLQDKILRTIKSISPDRLIFIESTLKSDQLNKLLNDN